MGDGFMQNQTLKVEGMSCGHCVASVQKALSQVGVNKVNVNLEKKTVQVEYDDTSVSLKVIKEAIEEQGYDVV
jgi:copper chaperone